MLHIKLKVSLKTCSIKILQKFTRIKINIQVLVLNFFKSPVAILS